MRRPPRYRAYLLRLWREDETAWRFSLEDAHSRERRGFASLEGLVRALVALTRDPAPSRDKPDLVARKEDTDDRQENV